MYIPKSKLTILYTEGNEFIIKSTQKGYAGPYIKTSNGKLYAGTNPSNLQTLLERALQTNENMGQSMNSVKYSILKKQQHNDLKNNLAVPGSKNIPTDKDYNRGHFLRYFLVRANGDFYKEVKLKTFNDYVSKTIVDENLYTVDKIKWALKEDVIETNRTTLRIAERKYPGLSEVFPLLNEFEKIEEYRIMGRSYSDGESIPSSLPSSYGLPKVATRNCSNCIFNIEGNCSKFNNSQIRNNHWCVSWENNKTMNPFKDIDSLDMDISTNMEHIKYKALKECTQATDNVRFTSLEAKEEWVNSCIQEKISTKRTQYDKKGRPQSNTRESGYTR
tara:strand:+ start:2977 stop:3972 length:996 start_codon:yes stop_codon:yes gene_type:complete